MRKSSKWSWVVCSLHVICVSDECVRVFFFGVWHNHSEHCLLVDVGANETTLFDFKALLSRKVQCTSLCYLRNDTFVVITHTHTFTHANFETLTTITSTFRQFTGWLAVWLLVAHIWFIWPFQETWDHNVRLFFVMQLHAISIKNLKFVARKSSHINITHIYIHSG